MHVYGACLILCLLYSDGVGICRNVCCVAVVVKIVF